MKNWLPPVFATGVRHGEHAGRVLLAALELVGDRRSPGRRIRCPWDRRPAGRRSTCRSGGGTARRSSRGWPGTRSCSRSAARSSDPARSRSCRTTSPSWRCTSSRDRSSWAAARRTAAWACRPSPAPRRRTRPPRARAADRPCRSAFPGLACGVGLLGLSLGLPVGLTVGDGLAVSSPPVKITRPATTSRTTAADDRDRAERALPATTLRVALRLPAGSELRQLTVSGSLGHPGDEPIGCPTVRRRGRPGCRSRSPAPVRSRTGASRT